MFACFIILIFTYYSYYFLKEYKSYLQDDQWRKYQLERSLCNKEHPYSQFGIGNIESLKEIPLKAGLDIREELIKHHEKYYSANLMKLVVLGRGES